jgi:hypothetical protein
METPTIYLSGCISQTLLANPRPDLGVMYQPGMQNQPGPLKFVPWGADNACYSQGDRFDAGDWLEWLASLRRFRERCLFAVAPDVVGDAEATLARSRPYLPTIRQLGFPAAYVTQDGCTSALVPWGECDALFVGGTDGWKLSEASWALCREAKLRGLHVHVGRVNSWRRMKACAVSGVDSVDGTYLLWGPDVNFPKLIDWLDSVNRQSSLQVPA